MYSVTGLRKGFKGVKKAFQIEDLKIRKEYRVTEDEMIELLKRGIKVDGVKLNNKHKLVIDYSKIFRYDYVLNRVFNEIRMDVGNQLDQYMNNKNVAIEYYYEGLDSRLNGDVLLEEMQINCGILGTYVYRHGFSGFEN